MLHFQENKSSWGRWFLVHREEGNGWYAIVEARLQKKVGSTSYKIGCIIEWLVDRNLDKTIGHISQGSVIQCWTLLTTKLNIYIWVWEYG